MTDQKTTLIIAISVILGCSIIGFNLKGMNPNPGAENSITVQGEGKSNIVPNIFVFTISANETGDTTTQVTEKIATKLDQAQKILADNSIDKKDIQSNNIYTSENQEYDGTKTVTHGYRGTHNLTIKVRDVSNAGKIIDQISAINGLLVQGGTYENDNEDTTLADARKKAFANAKAKAEELAKLAGVDLGKPISINESIVNKGYPYPVYGMATMDAKAESAPSTTINPGEKELQVQLNVVFETR